MKTTPPDNKALAAIAAEHGIPLIDLIDRELLAVKLIAGGTTAYGAAKLCGLSTSNTYRWAEELKNNMLLKNQAG